MAKVPVATDPAGIETQNRRWWELREAERPFHCTLPLDARAVWPLKTTNDAGRSVEEPVGAFCFAPMPVTGAQLWGFSRAADRDRFAGLYGGVNA